MHRTTAPRDPSPRRASEKNREAPRAPCRARRPQRRRCQGERCHHGVGPTAVPLTPMARLVAAEARLSAMIQAVDIVRDPLQRFYVLLSEEQRQRFNAMGDSGGGQAPAGGNVVALCSEKSSDVTKLPVERIEQVLQPSGQQVEAFNGLK